MISFLYIYRMIIYTLSDPISKEVRYVGLTIRPLKQRFSQHYSRKCNNHKCNWIKSLRNKGLKPVMQELDVANSIKELNDLEIYWIEQFKQWGFNLVNLTQGGEGSFGYKHTKESLNKMKEKLALRPKKLPVRRMTKQEQYASISKNLSKKVIEYSLEGDFIKVWDSRIEAATFYKITSSAIGHALRDLTRSCNGSLWRNFTEKFSKKIFPYYYTGNKRKIIVFDIILNREYTFNSITDAFVITGRPMNVNLLIDKDKLFKKRFKFITC